VACSVILKDQKKCQSRESCQIEFRMILILRKSTTLLYTFCGAIVLDQQHHHGFDTSIDSDSLVSHIKIGKNVVYKQLISIFNIIVV
jgi:hypothetical protein